MGEANLVGDKIPSRRSLRALAVPLKIAAAAGIIIYLGWRVGAAELMRQLASIDVLYYGVALLILGCQFAMLGWRWSAVIAIDTPPPPFAELLRYTLMANSASQILPTSLGGDVLRIYLMQARGTGVGDASKHVVVDRLLGLFGLVGAAALALLVSRAGAIHSATAPFIGAIASLLALGAALGLLALYAAGRWLPQGWISRSAKNLWNAAMSTVSKPRTLIALLCLSIAIQVLSSIVFWLISQGLGLDTRFEMALLIVPAVALASVVPITIGGWGVREGMVVWALVASGTAEAPALAASLLYGLTFTAYAVVAAPLFVLNGKRAPAAGES